MNRTLPVRYSDVAIGLHWLIALLIISLLAIGKFMTGLPEGDALRFELTQWHKSFGVTVMLLALFRLVWRMTHAAPAHPEGSPGWEKAAAGISHGAFYILMFAVPITGWIMTSASPLNIQTLLFKVVPWPHLPPFDSLDNKEDIAKSFHEYHELAGNMLIALLLLHVAAVLKHRLIDKDRVLWGMTPDWHSRGFRRFVKSTVAAVLLAGGGLWLYASQGGGSSPLQAGSSSVSFIATVGGSETPGNFDESSVSLTLDEQNPEANLLEAEVQTESFSTDDQQVNGSLGDPDWFDVKQHPVARFTSTSITPAGDGVYAVEGDMMIKGKTQTVSFNMTLADADGQQRATGEFPVDRLAYDIGAGSQPDDDSVGFEVIIRFDFEVTTGGN